MAGPIGWPGLRRGYVLDKRFRGPYRFKKALAVVEAGSTVTVVLPRSERADVSLSYSTGAGVHDAWTFHACPDEETQFNGGFIVNAPRCVAVDIYVGATRTRPLRRHIPFGTAKTPCPPT